MYYTLYIQYNHLISGLGLSKYFHFNLNQQHKDWQETDDSINFKVWPAGKACKSETHCHEPPVFNKSALTSATYFVNNFFYQKVGEWIGNILNISQHKAETTDSVHRFKLNRGGNSGWQASCQARGIKTNKVDSISEM